MRDSLWIATPAKEQRWIDRMGQWSAVALASGFYAGACAAGLAGNRVLSLACVAVVACCLTARKWLAV